MRILIDGRLYGLENAGLGRYVMNLVSELKQIDSKNQYILLLRKKYFNELPMPSNWQKVEADFHHYGFIEQIKLPNIINDYSPDIVHFPHLNVPIFFTGKFIVTIHDMLMHNQKGFGATTLNPIVYIFKKLVIKFVFAYAVKRSQKVIVPSKSVKNELLKFYKISSEKVEVIYEG